MVNLLSAKNRENLEKLHFPEADQLVQGFLNTTEKEGFVEVYTPLQLSSMNVVLQVTFGKHAESIEDPLFKDIHSIMTESMRRASVAEEINTFLPVLSVVDVVLRKRRDIQKFVTERRNPIINGLIEEALKSKVDCLAKTLKAELAEFNDYDQYMVSLGKIYVTYVISTTLLTEWM